MLWLLAGVPLALLWQVYVVRQLTLLLNIHQIEEYQNSRFWRWVRAAPTRLAHPLHAVVSLVLVVLWALAWFWHPALWAFLALAVVSVAAPIALAWRVEAVQAKKPLV